MTELPETLIVPEFSAPVQYEQQGGLKALIAARLKLPEELLGECRLLRRSLDARRRKFVYKIRAECQVLDSKKARKLVRKGRLQVASDPSKGAPDADILKGLSAGREDLEQPPIIVGTGPSGLFAAWLLAEYGFKPIVIERGRRVEKRVKDVRDFEKKGVFNEESNILFGEGGAGTFSDGKLTCRTKSPIKPHLLQLMVDCSAPEEIAFQSKPHIGTDRLRAVLVHLRRRLEKKGVRFLFESKMDELLLDDQGRVRGVRLEGGDELQSRIVLLGIGHSARDTYEMLHERGVAMEFKPFQLGLRIEHPQQIVDQFRYGQEGIDLGLPTAEYALKANTGESGRELFSFCMCPGGQIVPSVSQQGYLCTNGMSRHKRDSGWANSGLVYTIYAQDLDDKGPLAGLRLQQQIERRAFEMSHSYKVPAQRVEDFLKNRVSEVSSLRSSYPLGHVSADLRQLLPGKGPDIMARGLENFGKRWPQYIGQDGILVGPESRGSSPIRMLRDKDSRESSSTGGLYPIGEGAGFAGGILSAALDGVRSARVIVERFAPI